MFAYSLQRCRDRINTLLTVCLMLAFVIDFLKMWCSGPCMYPSNTKEIDSKNVAKYPSPPCDGAHFCNTVAYR